MPTSHPADTFEVGWVLHFLLQGGLRIDPQRNATHRVLLRWLRSCLTADGAGFARSSGLPPDADDTGMALAVLRRCGISVPLDSLWHFQSDTHFVCYAGERASSPSANAHVLEALLGASPLPSEDRARYLRHQRATQKVVEYLLDQRSGPGYWVDKWHMSPYYATLAAVVALCRAPLLPVHVKLSLTLDWLLDTQRGEGGWGVETVTAEETAYGLLAIRALGRILPFHQPERCSQAVGRGRRLLLDTLDVSRPFSLALAESPPQWLDKSPYAPSRVIRAAILAALR